MPWSLSSIYVGEGCPYHCHGRGDCLEGRCHCDKGLVIQKYNFRIQSSKLILLCTLFTLYCIRPSNTTTYIFIEMYVIL